MSRYVLTTERNENDGVSDTPGDEGEYRRFADLLRYLAPDISMDTVKMQEQLEIQGVDRFIQNAGGHAAALVGAAELLIYLEKGGAEYESE